MEELHKLSKLPPWAWGVAVAGGLALWWFGHRQSSGVSGSQGAGSSVVGSVNDATPQCQTYPLPDCQGQQVIWTQDGMGCPMPTCSGVGAQPPASPPDQYVTTDGKMTFSQAQYIDSCWGDVRIRAWIALHGHPQLASFSLFQPLPAGIKLKVCGVFD